MVKSKAILAEKTRRLTLNSCITILRQVKEFCLRWNVDVLDCSIRACRQKVDINFEEALSKFNENDFYLTIMRRDIYPENHIEICISSLISDPSYYVWAIVAPEYLDDIKALVRHQDDWEDVND